jgi:hypothetical protein
MQKSLRAAVAAVGPGVGGSPSSTTRPQSGSDGDNGNNGPQTPLSSGPSVSAGLGDAAKSDSCGGFPGSDMSASSGSLIYVDSPPPFSHKEAEEGDVPAGARSNAGNCIGHIALSKFWASKVHPKPSVKTNVFISQLIMYLAARRAKEIGPGYSAVRTGSTEDQRQKQYQMLRDRIDSERYIMNLFGGQAKLFEESVSASLDYDGFGFITAIKLDRATRSIPRHSNLLVVLYHLYYQQGVELLPSMVYQPVAERYVHDVNASLREREEIIASAVDKSSNSDNSDMILRKPEVICEFPPPVLPYEYVDVVGEDPMAEVITTAFHTIGWHLVGGPPCCGKSVRVLTCLRRFLKACRLNGQELSSASVARAVTTSRNILDPLRSVSMSQSSHGKLEGNIDAIYLDLRGCHSATEVISAVASQLVLSGDCFLEVEVHWHKLIESLRTNSVLLIDNVSSAQCAIVLTQLLDPYSRTLCIMIVTAGRVAPFDWRSSDSPNSPVAANPSHCSVPFASPIRVKGSVFTFNEAVLSSPSSASSSYSGSASAVPSSSLPASYDEVFIDVYEGLGGNARLDLTPFKKTIYYLDMLPGHTNASAIARSFFDVAKESSQAQAVVKQQMAGDGKDVNAPLFPSDSHVADTKALGDMVATICGGDICTMKLITKLPRKSILLLENMFKLRNASMPESLQRTDKLSADEIFMQSGNYLFEDRDCLAVIASCGPIMPLFQCFIDWDMLWALSKSLFMSMYCTRGNFGNISNARSRFDVAVMQLWSIGWLEMCDNNNARAYRNVKHASGFKQPPPLCISTAASRATQLYEHALVCVLDHCRDGNFKTKEDIASTSWSAYYAYWVKVLEAINLEFTARGQTLTATCQCIEGQSGGYVSSRISADRRVLYRKLTMRQLVDVVDVHMIHLFRLFSLWLRSPSPKDINTMAIISIASSRMNINAKEKGSANGDQVISPAANSGVLPVGSLLKGVGPAPKSSPRLLTTHDLDETTLKYLPELRSTLDQDLSDAWILSQDKLRSCSYDPFDGQGNNAAGAGVVVGRSLPEAVEADGVVKQLSVDTSRPASGSLNGSDASNNKSQSKSALLSNGPISTVFRGSGLNAKLAAVFTTGIDGAGEFKEAESISGKSSMLARTASADNEMSDEGRYLTI